MAHIENYKRGAVGHMLDHYSREAGDGVDRSNENIDESRTRLNYVVAKKGLATNKRLESAYRSAVYDAIAATDKKRASEGRKPLYKSSAVLSDWVVTLPDDCPKDKQREFFNATVNFCVRRYGNKNVLGGFVHLDETTPHVHIPVLPILEDGTIDKASVISRKDLRTFHEDLQAFVDERLGCHVTVQLPEEEVLKKAMSKLSRDELSALNNFIDDSVASKTALEREKLAKKERELDGRERRLDAAYGVAIADVERYVGEAYDAQQPREKVVADYVEKFKEAAIYHEDEGQLYE